MKHFKTLLYTILLSCLFPAHAGSFEDFFIAIRNDNAAQVRELLGRGFDPNTRDAKGQPGLTLALQEHSLKAARALLDAAATDVNALNAAQESALMIGALKGDVDGVRLLLERGARVQQAGWTPLHYAATGPQPALVGLLLDRGASIDARSPNGTTPLMMAAQYGSEDSVQLLLDRGADARLLNQRNLSAADFARLAGRDKLAERLAARLR
jgi:ankyrin repeat protein